MLSLALHATWWQALIIIVLYAAYLWHILYGGLTPKRLVPKALLQRSIVYFALIWIFFDGLDGLPAIACLLFCIALGLAKGCLLGRMKKVELIDEEYCVYHRKEYVITWVVIYVFKLIAQAMLVAAGGGFHLWFTCAYYFVMSSTRSGFVMRKYRRLKTSQTSQDLLNNLND